MYLWHWPVLVLADAGWGPLNWTQRAAAVVISVGLSALSFRFVEDPVRHSRWLAAVPARSLGFGAVMVLIMLSAGWALSRSIPALDGGQAAAAPQLLVVPRRQPGHDDRPGADIDLGPDHEPRRPDHHRRADDHGGATGRGGSPDR